MLFGLLFRRETLLLAGVTAVFAVPMFRNGDLSVRKITHWVANGIAESTAESGGRSEPAGFAVWTPQSGSSGSVDLIPASKSSGQGSWLGLLGDVLQTEETSSTTSTTTTVESSGAGAVASSDVGYPGQVYGIPAPTSVDDSRAALQPFQGVESTEIPAHLAGWIPINDLREIIRFDVSPQWVQQRWSPATALDRDDDGYYGFRVPLESGPTVGQVNGALTYFFDIQGKVQRIQFVGSAANTSPLLSLLVTYFRFEPVTDRVGLYAPIHKNAARGMFRFGDASPSVGNEGVKPGFPATQTEVAFEINSTQGRYTLSEAFRRIAIDSPSKASAPTPVK